MAVTQRWGGRDWSVTVLSNHVVLDSDASSTEFRGLEAKRLEVARRWFRWCLVVDGIRRFKGLPRHEAATLDACLVRFLTRQQLLHDEAERQERVEGVRFLLRTELEALSAWHGRVKDCFTTAVSANRWVAHDTVQALVSSRPRLRVLRNYETDPDLTGVLTKEEREQLHTYRSDLEVERRRQNKIIGQRELKAQAKFLATIEKSPLTDEQARAVVCFDNRVQVIAAAGAGKTSVMVARAAYAIKRGFVPAGRILLLAFNDNAAKELDERIKARLRTHDLGTKGLRAATFHSFGLSMIGQATGAKPGLAPWLDEGRDLEMVERIVDELRDESPAFRYKWDLYRLVFARAADTPEGTEPEWWDPDTKVSGHRTMRGETVRSKGEQQVADWLFFNGVQYEYERPYAHRVADADHSQYRPDFYYPDIDVWHEHWAVGPDGKPVEAFVGYAEGMKWKRGIHRQYGTTLLETTWAEIMDKSGFEPLERSLREHGLELDWNPDRTVPNGARPMEHRELAKLVRSFMSHVKSNSLDRSTLDARLKAGTHGLNHYRSRLFIDLYWDIHDAWERRLASEDCVDFEDMLVKAAEVLESGQATSSYDLILVDEFQDSSAARARLVKALIQGDDKYLLTVGDDWQSIYRFAGSDVSVMTDFEKWFGPTETLRLQTTFRSTQTITDVASTFVSKNPRQLRKKVTSAQGPGGAPVVLATVKPTNPNQPEPELSAAVHGYLRHLSDRLDTGEIPPGPDGKVTVDVLGRYRFERDLLPQRLPPGLTVEFRTVHRAKGLEADYVLMPRVVRGTVGFPSQIEDDPVLNLVMADPDPYPFGEERRLFYVALTRARREVAMITVEGRESPFVVEMLKDGVLSPLTAAVNGSGAQAARASAQVCPGCGEGLLVPRNGKFGLFYGCARFPACRYTQNAAPS